MGAALAGFAVGLFYACAGWNKLALKRRRNEMHYNIAETFRVTLKWAVPLANFISTNQLVFGCLAMIGAATGFAPAIVLSNAALLTISLSAFALVTHEEMTWDWRPINAVDYVACCLYMPEVLLAVLSVTAILGAL